MTLNPSAQVFVPSSQTLRLLKCTSAPAVDPEKDQKNHKFSPPQLESLYIDSSGFREDEDMFSHHAQSVSRSIDYSNFDLPFFFHDMLSADTEDFANYLSDRAEYLLGYAGTSQMHALEVVDTILEHVYDMLRATARDYMRPLKLAAEMCDMDPTFLQIMLQQTVRLLIYLENPVNQDPAYSVLIGLVLGELHIGTCIAPPETELGFGNEVYQLFLRLLQDRKSITAAIFALRQCEDQLKAILKPQQIDSICAALRKLSVRFHSTEFNKRCIELQKGLHQSTAHPCLKPHAMPIAQLNEEEAQDFEMFLLESRRNFSQCRS